jgi:uncharacterized protein YciI
MSDPVVHHVLFYDYVEDVVEKQPPTGGMLVFLVEDAAEVEGFAADDPYVRNGIVTAHRVVPWTVVI